jgi:flagellin
MSNSVNTNSSAIVALSSLNNTVGQLTQIQKRVTTGYKVADAVDDGAAFAVAQSIRSDKGAYDAVNSQLNAAKGAVSVFTTAATNISNTLMKARETLTKLADDNLTTDMRTKYNNDYTALRAEVQNYVSNAKFNGKNLLSGSFTQIQVISGIDGSSYTVGSGAALTMSAKVAAAFTVPASAISAAAILTGAFASAESNIGSVLNTLGADMRRIDAQVKYNSSIQDSLTQSLGAIVDADLAKESANLQAAQIKQTLGGQTLGIANSAPQILQSLFR